MLRKLIFFASASGLAKKAYSTYREKSASSALRPLSTPMPTARGRGSRQSAGMADSGASYTDIR